MKCQKCNAENIVEAVRCGICGTRLKHPKQWDDFSGQSNSIASKQRVNSLNAKYGNNQVSGYSNKVTRSAQAKAQHAKLKSQSNSNIQQSDTPNFFESLIESVQTEVNKTGINRSAETKQRIFLDSWQKKAKAELGAKSQPKFKKWWFIVAFVLLGGLPLLERVVSVVFNEISYQIRERNRIAEERQAVQIVEDDVAVPVDAVAAVDIADEAVAGFDDEHPLYLDGYQDLKLASGLASGYYQEKGRLPTSLKELRGISEQEYLNINVSQAGVIYWTSTRDPSKQILMVPSTHEVPEAVNDWQCYSVNIQIPEVLECDFITDASDYL